MEIAVSDAELAAYRHLSWELAHYFKGVGGAEFDDLEQEGWIACWQLHSRGLPVSKTAIKNRMRDWCRKCRRNGFVGYEAEATS